MENQALPQVLLVVTTHERSTFLPEAIASARRQTYENVRIVLSDDGSTNPDLIALLDQYESEGLQVLRHPSGGVSASLNAAVRAVESDYVMRLDDDDLIEPTYIEEAVAVAESDPEIGIVYSRATMFGTVTGPWLLPDFEIGRILLDNLIFPTSLVRRADWLAVGGHDEAMLEGREDHDFVLRILGLGRRPVRLEGVHFHYRQHGETSRNATIGASREALIRAHAAIFRNNAALYADNAEEFWRLILQRVDEVNDLRYRYERWERLRTGHPRIIAAAKAARSGLLSIRGRAQIPRA